MGRIDPALIKKGEGSTLKIIKFRGHTQIGGAGHVHKFVVYTDDTVEIFEHVHIDEEGVQHKHRHKYVGEYPNGYIMEDHVGHVHKIVSVAHPIKFEKEVYGKKAFSKMVNAKLKKSKGLGAGSSTPDEAANFSELFKQQTPMTVDDVFDKLDEVFYDIPDKGPRSHTSLIQNSLEIIQNFDDPRDAEIEEMSDELIELEKKLQQQEMDTGVEKQHSIFQNGAFLRNGVNTYYMQKGAKRRIIGEEVYNMLKRAQGHPPARANEEIWIEVTDLVLEGIDTGPEFREEDVNVGPDETRKEVEEKKMVKLDPDDFKIDPTNYKSTSEYLEVLDREVRQKAALEDYQEQLRYRYQRDVRDVTDDDERAEAQTRLDEVTEQLKATRNAIIRYSKILRSVDPDGDLKNITIDTSELKKVVDGEMQENISENELAEWHKNVFLGEDNKSRMRRFVDGFNRPDELDKSGAVVFKGEPSTTENSQAGVPFWVEELPEGTPDGFRPNPNGTLRNRNIKEMADLSKIGMDSPGGDWYWAPKVEFQFKLQNSSPVTSMLSKYIWDVSKFEWVPKGEKRMFQGQVVDNIQ